MNQSRIKLLSIVLTLALLAGLVPVTAAAAVDHRHSDWTEWTVSDSLPAVAGEYALSGNVLLTSSWVVPKGITRLCLEGHSIIFSGNSGCVIQVPENASLELYDLDGNVGLITGGKGTDSTAVFQGGGVSVRGRFTMYGGQIKGNTAISGGGVHVDGGTFRFFGGLITGNSATENGGGVSITDGEFNIFGASTVTGNTKGYAASNVYLGTGVNINVIDTYTGTLGLSSADEPTAGRPVTLSLTLNGYASAGNFTSDVSSYLIDTNSSDELILKYNDPASFRFPAWNYTSNLPSEAGDYSLRDNIVLNGTWKVPTGGTTRICLEGRSITAGCVIEVPTGAILEIYDRNGGGGFITGGKGKLSGGYTFGGGVYVKGVFRQYGGTVTGNTATSGGGVYADADAVYCLDGGKVTGNTATISGGGVYVRGAMQASGAVDVTGNTKNGAPDNVRLAANALITVSSAVSGAMGINTASVPAANSPIVLTSGFKDKGALSLFTSDNAAYTVALNNAGEAVLSLASTPAPTESPAPTASPAPTESPAPTASPAPTTDPSLKFGAWTATDAMPTVAGDYSLAGNVTLRESWTAPQGTTRICLEGHSLTLNANTGSVILVPAGAILELYDASSGTGVVTGGNGWDGYGFRLGGGVYVAGYFTLYGGTISGNTATSGGGIFIDTTGGVHLAGGKVTNNSATINGGGVFSRGILSVSGTAAVTGNTKDGQPCNVYLSEARPSRSQARLQTARASA